MPLPFKFHTALIAVTLLAASLTLHAQGAKPSPDATAKATVADNSPAEDFSGMYSFLKEGEFIQITMDKDGASGYISRQGDQDSDRGVFLDQWFSKISVKNYDVSFTTKPLHSVWFEFKGVFSRGATQSKSKDGYYLLKGTLTEHTSGPDGKNSSRSMQLESKLLASPDEDPGK